MEWNAFQEDISCFSLHSIQFYAENVNIFWDERSKFVDERLKSRNLYVQNIFCHKKQKWGCKYRFTWNYHKLTSLYKNFLHTFLWTGNFNTLIPNPKQVYWDKIKTNPNIFKGSDLSCLVPLTGLKLSNLLFVIFTNLNKGCITSFDSKLQQCFYCNFR